MAKLEGEKDQIMKDAELLEYQKTKAEKDLYNTRQERNKFKQETTMLQQHIEKLEIICDKTKLEQVRTESKKSCEETDSNSQQTNEAYSQIKLQLSELMHA